MGDKAGVVSAVIAAGTALAAGGTWIWQQTSGPADSAGVAGATTAPVVATPGPGTTAPSSVAAPPAAADTPLDTVTRLGGETAALPEDVSAANYARPVVVACPSNQTGDQTRSLTYDLDRRFRSFTATVSGWAESGTGDPIEVRVFTRTRQKDDTFVTREAGAQTGGIKQSGRPLTARVTGADELLVEVRCHRPGGVVILDRAALAG